jgi:hypothetical protein
MTRSAAHTSELDAHEGRATERDEPFVVRLRRVASEPFLHFALLGALVFAGHRVVARTSSVPTLEVSASKQRELSKLFEQRQHRVPTDADCEQLVRRYVEDETLFREGLRLSLVQTDPLLRAQVIARVRGLLQAELQDGPPTEAELQRYYETHRSDYAAPNTLAPEPPFARIRDQVSADYRKDRTGQAFQAQVERLTSQWHVRIAKRP